MAVTVRKSVFDDALDSTAIWIEGGGAKSPAVKTGGLHNAIAKLRECDNSIAPGLGIDPAAMAQVVTPATEIGVSNWFSSFDYRASAIRDPVEGETRIVWAIGINGRVSDCHAVRSSGNVALDEGACITVTQRARYRPALNAAGQPTKSWGSRRIVWIID